MRRNSRFKREPDLCVNITQKHANNRESWTIHESQAKADSEVARTSPNSYWQTYGRFYKMRYRVNVYYHERNIPHA